jgi:hypothetical protein
MAKNFFNKLQPNQQTKLKELIKEEAKYSESAQKQALGDFHFFLENKFLDNFEGMMSRFTTLHRSKTKSKDEVFDFFKKREEKCEGILKHKDFIIDSQPVDASLNLADGDGIKGDPIKVIWDLFGSLAEKIEKVLKENTDQGAEAGESLPKPVVRVAANSGLDLEASSYGSLPSPRVASSSSASAAAPPRPLPRPAVRGSF